MLLEKLNINAAELAAINKHTLREYSENEVFSFAAKFIDDTVTENGRIWSREWQAANVAKFSGVPVVINHENNQQLVLGRVYQSEIRDNAIHGKIYVPLDTDVGKEARTKIEGGLFKSVSIGAKAENVKQEGKHTRILPSDSDHVYEVSFVAIPGCSSCGVKKESACSCGKECSCQSAISETVGNNDASLLEFARGELQNWQNEFVRLTGIILEINDRPLLEKVAQALDPNTLKVFSGKLREHHNKSHLMIGRDTAPATTEDSDTQRIRESLSNIRKYKGV
jgi:hypothetical protein